VVSLAKDPRVPSSLESQLWQRHLALANLHSQKGEAAAAERSLADAMKGVVEQVAQFRKDDVRHQIFAGLEARARARLQLNAGNWDAAFTAANDEFQRLDGIAVPADSVNATRTRDNSMRGALQIAVPAALASGRLAQAEALARRLQNVPPDPQSDADPRVDASLARAFLAHSLVLQDRREEAQKELAPALDFYRQQQKAGARATGYLRDFTYALYVSALAQDGAGRAAALAEAQRVLGGMSEEARQLTTMRRLAGWIADARAGQGG
jgi:hypothetical protein